MTLSFRSELTDLADRVRDHPLLELLVFDVQEPPQEAEFQAAEAQLGAPLPESLRRLYETLGSATLRWRFRPDLDEATRARVAEDFSEAVTRHNLYDAPGAGAIDIVPLLDMLFDEEYSLPEPDVDDSDGGFEFDGVVYSDREFCAMLRPFDVVSDFFAMAHVVQPERKEWKLLFLSDHWIEYDSSRTVYLEDYLRYVLATWGLVDARYELFSEYRGDRREPLHFDLEKAAARLPEVLVSGR